MAVSAHELDGVVAHEVFVDGWISGICEFAERSGFVVELEGKELVVVGGQDALDLEWVESCFERLLE